MDGLICQLCNLPIESINDFSPVLLKCYRAFQYETYCHKALDKHREHQNDCGNISLDDNGDVSRFSNITQEQLDQTAEYTGTNDLNDKINDIKNDFPDDSSLLYINCCQKCCLFFPTTKDSGKFNLNFFDY